MKTHILTIALAAIILAAPHRAHAQMPNPYGPNVTVESARKIAAVAGAEGKKNGWNIAVAIVDTAGDLVYFERADNTQVASATISQDKARTAARFKRPSKALEDAIAGGRNAVIGLAATQGIVPLEGGIPLVVDGKIVGAIGVSGATSPQDGQCAQAGADALSGKPPAPKAPTPPAPTPAPPKK